MSTVWVVLGGFRPHTAQPVPTGDSGATPADGVPKLVPKLARPVSGDGGVVLIPPGVGDVAVEGELAVVIGAPLCRPSLYEAAAAIRGFTCFNDVTAMALLPTGDWSLAKSFDTFASMGPAVVEDLNDDRVMAGLSITTRVNGDVRQTGNTRWFKFPPAEVVRYLAAHTSLAPGDVISLGTPPPAAVVQPGDEVEIEVEGVGILHNTIR